VDGKASTQQRIGTRQKAFVRRPLPRAPNGEEADSGACLDGGVNEVNEANLPLRCQTCVANVVGQMFWPPNSIYP
jgi:hypothetical protein